MVEVTVSELFKSEIEEFLNVVAESKYGVPFSAYSEYEKSEVIEDLCNAAIRVVEMDIGRLNIKGKYLKSGHCGIFELNINHFNFVLNNCLTGFKEVNLK